MSHADDVARSRGSPGWDKVLEQLVRARITEPASELDSVLVQEEAGIAGL